MKYFAFSDKCSSIPVLWELYCKKYSFKTLEKLELPATSFVYDNESSEALRTEGVILISYDVDNNILLIFYCSAYNNL